MLKQKVVSTNKLENSSEQLVKKYRVDYVNKIQLGNGEEDLARTKKNLQITAFTPNSSQSQVFAKNDKIILAQINFCRYLMRLSKLTEEFALNIKLNLKPKLIFLILKNVMLKIDRLSNMCKNHTNLLNLEHFQEYISNSDSYQKFVLVINQYQTKYDKVFQETKEQQLAEVQNTSNHSDLFYFQQSFLTQTESELFYWNVINTLKQVIMEINQNLQQIVSAESAQQQLDSQIEGQIILLDYLITYYQIVNLILESKQSYEYFAQASKIE